MGKKRQKTLPKYNMERSPDNKHQAIPIGVRDLNFCYILKSIIYKNYQDIKNQTQKESWSSLNCMCTSFSFTCIFVYLYTHIIFSYNSNPTFVYLHSLYFHVPFHIFSFLPFISEENIIFGTIILFTKFT